MKVRNRKEAWKAVDEIFPTDYIKDEKRTAGAGYDVYGSTAEDHYYDYICDLGERLEVNLSDGRTINVWFDADPEFSEYQIEDALEVISEAIYQIDDKVNGKLAEKVGIETARNLLYKGYDKLYHLLLKDYPESDLIKKFNLA